MLVGELVDLTVLERDDLPLIQRWSNDLEFVGEFEPFHQSSLHSMQKHFDELKDTDWFIVSTKDGERIGYVLGVKFEDCFSIGYSFVPEARGKGLGTEAVRMLVDYIFMHRDVARIQAETHPDNLASQRVLEKAGFQKEGVLRARFFSRGVWRNTAMWSVIRSEWGGPRVLPAGHVPE